MCIIVTSAHINIDLTEVNFVVPKILHSNKLTHLNKINRINIETSRKICSELGIKFNILYEEQISSSCNTLDFFRDSIIDSSLKGYLGNFKSPVVYLSGDNHCSFGFSDYKNFMFTKLKLTYLWRKSTNYRQNFPIYTCGERDKKLGLEILPKNEIIKNLEKISIVFEQEVLSVSKLHKSKNYILVLPPDPSHFGQEFTKHFFHFADNLSKERKLEIFIKPHRITNLNSLMPFVDKYTSYKDLTKVMYLHAEFFFTLECVKYILAIPSTSLALADKSKVEVLLAKDPEVYRTKFLDQEPFLEFMNIRSRRI